MKTFVGFGFGPIQSALFLYEAFKSGNFSRFVIAEVDQRIVDGVRSAGGRCTINIALPDRVEQATITGIELYNPSVDGDRRKIQRAVAESDELATALPSVAIYDTGGQASVARTLEEGFSLRTAQLPTHYPRRYGPAAPSFSRAMVLPDDLLLVSGTASIVGHASMHPGDTEAQLRETLVNLDVLLHRAQAAGKFASARPGPDSLIKVYLRHARDAGLVERELREQLGPDVPILILAADICRSELLIEIELVHRC